MAGPRLVTIEMRFTTSENEEQVAERIREATRMIVGRDALEDFRVRSTPLEPPKDRIRPL
jgi:hypothetical protein